MFLFDFFLSLNSSVAKTRMKGRDNIFQCVENGYKVYYVLFMSLEQVEF